jgi:hypothetical protein
MESLMLNDITEECVAPYKTGRKNIFYTHIGRCEGNNKTLNSLTKNITDK